MFDEKIKQKMIRLNNKLKQRDGLKPSKEELRKDLSEIGTFTKISKMNASEISNLSNSKGILGVDGSYVILGETYPNVMFFAQAVAKCTTDSKNSVKNIEVLSGIFNSNEETDEGEIISEYGKKMAEMEVAVAIEGIHTFKPFAVFMDGGFWRLAKNSTQICKQLWKELSETCINENILLTGIIESIGSYDLSILLELKTIFPDKDLLFGLLDIGEVYILNNPYKGGFLKVFARFSRDPMPIACDFLPEQQNKIMDMLRLIYSLTPAGERGIPLWIDIVDDEAKITREMAYALLDAYIDPVLKEKIFIDKRNKRFLF